MNPRARRPSARALLACSILGVGTLACREPDVEDVPNRVLDRPSDVALTCVQVMCPEDDDACHVEARSLNQCANERNDCDDFDAEPAGVDGSGKSDGSFHLVGFVANSERNEVAMFTRCSGTLVDMDQETPGYNFISVGALPTDLTRTTDSCRVVSSNRGSCTLSVLDAENLAGYGLGLPSPGGGASLAKEIVPLRYDLDSEAWVPLAAWPGEIIAVPPALSHGISQEEVDPVFVGCSPEKAGSVYMTFPSCGLVAEVDLLSGYVLQSFQLLVDPATGEVEVIDRGQAPECAVDCPALFEDEVPDLTGDASATLRPQALALVTPDDNHNPFAVDADGDDETAIVDSSLYVGGLGADRLVEIRMDDEGNWIEEDVLDLGLEEASGVARVRASPVLTVGSGDTYQFLYVITGDGATRVVSRDFTSNRTELGRECDTQVDPVVRETEDLYCPAVAEAPGDDPPVSRRGFARGPGIQAPSGAKFTDWSFQRHPTGEGTEEEDSVGSVVGSQGTIAIGTTNFGGIVFSVIDDSAFRGLPTDLPNEDPAGLFETTLWPHTLYPQILPSTTEVAWWPLVADTETGMNLDDESDAIRHLAPSLRLVDHAYVDDGLAARFGGMGNADHMGSSEAGEAGAIGFYKEHALRAVVRDYRSWGSSDWELQWEGEIPGSSSSAGRVECDNPGWADASCLATEPDSSRLVREGGAFCDAGVLPGDKLVLLGCVEDDECGIGQRCLREAGGTSSGICISEQAYEQDAEYLQAVCAEFISDPCGETYREYLVTRAFQDELWLQALDVPVVSFLDEYEPCELGSNNRIVVDEDGAPGCACLPSFEECTDAEDPEGPDCCSMYPGDGVDGAEGEAGSEDGFEPNYARTFEHTGRMVCTDEQIDGGCSAHADCVEISGEQTYCIEGKCMRECEGYGSDDCTFRRLPGPACFSEFVRFRVNAHKSFILRGAGAASFITDHVEVEDHGPDAGTQRFECVDRSDEATKSQLMTSRIRLPADSAGLLDIPECGSDVPLPSDANPCRIVDSRSTQEASRFHRFRYDGYEVPALRFSNPVLSIVLDLTSLMGLGHEIPGREGEHWAPEFRLFQRSRIPRGYAQRFSTIAGYTPLHDGVVLAGSPLTFPTRIVNAPEYGYAYVVDSSGPGSGISIRGQVMRINLSGNPVLADENFDGVR